MGSRGENASQPEVGYPLGVCSLDPTLDIVDDEVEAGVRPQQSATGEDGIHFDHLARLDHRRAAERDAVGQRCRPGPGRRGGVGCWIPR